MVLIHVFTAFVLVLKPQRKGPAVPFVSLLSNSVIKSPWLTSDASPKTFRLQFSKRWVDLFLHGAEVDMLEATVFCVVLVVECENLIQHIPLRLEVWFYVSFSNG